MPTIRPRHQITETPEIAAALDRAARRWPGESRARLLVNLVQAGDEALEERHAAYLTLIDELAGKYGDAYPPGYLEELRQDWPE